MKKTIDELAKQMISEGGCIVSSQNCSEAEIGQALVCGRWAQVDCFGFVLRPQTWLNNLNK